MAVPKGRRPRDDKKDAQVYEPGVQGRKTGITLPQGARDEHGIEDLDGIFSSPEKPAPQRNGNGSTTLTSSDMAIAQSSAPEPTEVLSTRRLTLKSSRTTLPPPMGRSPYKTNIGSSPRRQSSVKPRRGGTDTPELLEPRPTVTRRLDFGAGDESGVSSLRKPAKRKSTSARKSDVYTLEATDEEVELEEELPLPMEEDESMQLLPEGGEYDDAPVLDEPSEPEQISSPSRARSSRASHSLVEQQADESIQPAPSGKKKRGRPSGSRKSLPEPEEDPVRAAQKPAQRRGGGKAPLHSTRQAQIVDESVDESTISEAPGPAARGKKGAKGKGRSRQLPTPEDTQPTPDDPIETTELDDSVVSAGPSRGAAKGKGKRKLPVYNEEESELPPPVPPVEEATELDPDPSPRPSKRSKKSVLPPKKKTTTATKKQAPKERNPNIPTPHFKKPDPPTAGLKGEGARWDESMWASSRNMSRLRDPTPSAEAMVGRTRSGRQVIKPLNHFANERAQYSRDGTLLAVQTAETVERPTHQNTTRGSSRAPTGRGKSRGASRARMSVVREEEEEEEEDAGSEMEDWEARGEMIYGEVSGYDALTGQTLAETFETELAWSATAIPLMPVSSANFGFAKLLSMPFFGSGIMEFPVGGYKKPRNSGKTSLHVFVHSGKVWVKVGGSKSSGNMFRRQDEDERGNAFTVSRGGSFHVPRGNLYEIKNVSDKSARLFFAQGTEMVVAE